MVHKLLRESKRRGLATQDAVEKSVGFPQGRISKWLKGTGTPGWEDIVRWARAIDVPLEWLADDAQDELPQPDPADQELAMVVRLLGAREVVRRAMLPQVTINADPPTEPLPPRPQGAPPLELHQPPPRSQQTRRKSS